MNELTKQSLELAMHDFIALFGYFNQDEFEKWLHE